LLAEVTAAARMGYRNRMVDPKTSSAIPACCFTRYAAVLRPAIVGMALDRLNLFSPIQRHLLKKS